MKKKDKPPAKRGKFWKAWIERHMAEGGWKAARDVYARTILTDGYPLKEEQMVAIGRIYRPKDELPGATFKKRLASVDRGRRPFLEDVIRAMSEMVSNVIGHDVLEKQAQILWAAYESAMESGDSAKMLKVAQELDKYTNETLRRRLEVEAKASQAQLPSKDAGYLLKSIEEELEQEDS